MGLPEYIRCWHWTWKVSSDQGFSPPTVIYRCTRCDYPIASDHGNPSWKYRKEKIVELAKTAAALSLLTASTLFVVAVGVSIIALAVRGAN